MTQSILNKAADLVFGWEERDYRYAAIGGALSFGALCFGSRSSNAVFLGKIVAVAAIVFGLLGMAFARISEMMWKSARNQYVPSRQPMAQPVEEPSRALSGVVESLASPPSAPPPATIAHQTVNVANNRLIIVQPKRGLPDKSNKQFFDVSKYGSGPVLEADLTAHLESISRESESSICLTIALETASVNRVNEIVEALKCHLSTSSVRQSFVIAVYSPSSSG